MDRDPPQQNREGIPPCRLVGLHGRLESLQAPAVEPTGEDEEHAALLRWHFALFALLGLATLSRFTSGVEIGLSELRQLRPHGRRGQERQQHFRAEHSEGVRGVDMRPHSRQLLQQLQHVPKAFGRNVLVEQRVQGQPGLVGSHGPRHRRHVALLGQLHAGGDELRRRELPRGGEFGVGRQRFGRVFGPRERGVGRRSGWHPGRRSTRGRGRCRRTGSFLGIAGAEVSARWARVGHIRRACTLMSAT
ncbi:hypothetical protein DFJ74DRAFT_661589 [Hyaloraphidium curvatum]|nr:hypothetical protein DFJ74DRAFT_661589 [Hyaloraphidium curvatum]